MAIALTPLPPQRELEELCTLLGSSGAAARFLGRQRAQIGRWRKGEVELRDDSVELIDGAWHVICLIDQLVGAAQVPAAVHQRWPLLNGQTPAQLLHDRPDDLLQALRAAASDTIIGTAASATSPDTDLDEEIGDWFAGRLVANPDAPQPIVAMPEDADEDEEFTTPPRMLDDSWRGGRSMSSERWSKQQ